MMILIVLTLLFLIYYFDRNKSLNLDFGRKNALDILDEKFANGEISEEEYISKKLLLKDRR